MSEDLLALLKLFKESKGPLSAKKIATKFSTLPATAKRRVEALQVAGYKFSLTEVREGRRGFPSTAWRLRE